MSYESSKVCVKPGGSPTQLPMLNGTRTDQCQSEVPQGTVQNQLMGLNPCEGPGACTSSRRHGRFLVQPLMDANLSTTPSSGRTCSPATKPPLVPSKIQSSPTMTASLISERRPSRIIGRFEVSELFEEPKASGCTNSPQMKSIDAIQNELNNISETCATTPVKDQEIGA